MNIPPKPVAPDDARTLRRSGPRARAHFPCLSGGPSPAHSPSREAGQHHAMPAPGHKPAENVRAVSGRRLGHLAGGASAPPGAGMMPGHPRLAPPQCCSDLHRRDAVPLERLDQRADFVSSRVHEPVAFFVSEGPPPLASQPRHRGGQPPVLGFLLPDDSAVCAEFPRGSEFGPTPPTRVWAPPRLVRRAADSERFLRREAVAVPVGTGGDVVGTVQVNAETGEPPPALVTQDPARCAIDQRPQTMATGLPRHPQFPPSGQPQPLLQPISMHPTQRANVGEAVTAKSGTPGHDVRLAPKPHTPPHQGLDEVICDVHVRV